MDYLTHLKVAVATGVLSVHLGTLPDTLLHEPDHMLIYNIDLTKSTENYYSNYKWIILLMLSTIEEFNILLPLVRLWLTL